MIKYNLFIKETSIKIFNFMVKAYYKQVMEFIQDNLNKEWNMEKEAFSLIMVYFIKEVMKMIYDQEKEFCILKQNLTKNNKFKKILHFKVNSWMVYQMEKEKDMMPIRKKCI